MTPLNLKKLAGLRYRTSSDESAEITPQEEEDRAWLIQIPCKFGHIAIHSSKELSAYCNRLRIIPRLLAVDGVRVHQRGDKEVRVLFKPKLLHDVAAVLRAKERPKLTPEDRERRRAQMAGVRALKKVKL